MHTIKITTSQNIELEYELPSLGDRIIGYIIDFLVMAAYVILLSVILNYSPLGHLASWTTFLFFLPVFFYSILSETLLNGQSVGKKAMSMKVISLTGEQASFSQYLIRWLFRIVDFYIFSGLIATISVAVSDKKQRIGDLVAGTTLVRTKSKAAFSQTLYAPTVNPEYHVTYPEVINLRDGDIQLVKEVILSVQKTGNTMLALQAQNKIEQVLQIRSRSAEPMFFLHSVLADYNYLTSTM